MKGGLSWAGKGRAKGGRRAGEGQAKGGWALQTRSVMGWPTPSGFGVGPPTDVSERGSVHSQVSGSREKRVSQRVAKPSSQIWRRSAMRCVTSRDAVDQVWRRSA